MNKKIYEKIMLYGGDILASDGMLSEKKYMHHGDISCYEHSVSVAEKSLAFAEFLSIKVDERALVRGALLHDYFLYDWHTEGHGLHGFYHAARALKNASADFELGDIERNIIIRHMFPLNICPPGYAESWIVCAADKFCAMQEFFAKHGVGLVKYTKKSGNAKK